MPQWVAPKLTASEPPPPHYYADNLRQLLSHVQHQYGDILSAQELELPRRVSSLARPAQRLLARLLGRKGPWIRIDRLRYREIANLSSALRELRQSGLLGVCEPAPADVLLGLLTQAERRRLFPAALGAPRQLRKHQSISACLSRYPDHLIAQRIATQYPWLCVTSFALFHRYQLLFFGGPQQDLSAFILQDLGMRKYAAVALCRQTRQFADRGALDRYLRLLTLSSLSQRVGEVEGLAGALLEELTVSQADGMPNRGEQRQRDKVLNRLGRWFERCGEEHSALLCYQHSGRPPARERRVRLLSARQDVTAARQLIAQIKEQPWSAQEQDFAERFRQRRRCRIPTTQLALNGQRRDPEQGIEQHAIGVLTRVDGLAWHLENGFPLSLTGLAYWDVVFAQVPGAFVNPFQSAPVDLFWEDFLRSRAPFIDRCEDRLRQDPGGALRDTYSSKFGITNRLVNWAAFTPQVLEAALANIEPAQILRLVRHVLENLAMARAGFPDLFVVKRKGDYEFVEVKAPTDRLQPSQRIWFQTLARLGMPARVLKFTA